MSWDWEETPYSINVTRWTHYEEGEFSVYVYSDGEVYVNIPEIATIILDHDDAEAAKRDMEAALT